MTEFDIMYNVLGIVLAVQLTNLAFQWSLHYKVTKLQADKDHCVFCKSDVSMDEFIAMKGCSKVHNAYGEDPNTTEM